MYGRISESLNYCCELAIECCEKYEWFYFSDERNTYLTFSGYDSFPLVTILSQIGTIALAIVVQFSISLFNNKVFENWVSCILNT